MMNKIRNMLFGLLVAAWAFLVVFGWFGPKKDMSESERRPLAQMPAIKTETILSGKFMTAFDEYALDQFPGRDLFRQMKSLFHYYALRQSDNNDIYIADGYAVKQEYPLNNASLTHAAEKLNNIYEKYLKDSGSEIYLTVIPDKGYYLAETSGHLALDYGKLIGSLREQTRWAEYVDITDTLDASCYYFTDTHWRQEKIMGTAERLCEALGVESFGEGELTPEMIERPFYGVYYGQAALPMDPEEMYVLSGSLMENCTVYDHETGKTGAIYDMSKLDSRDLYDVYLSGARALLTIENPNAITDRELIVFRDSFGSSLIPLLAKDYSSVTVVDIRYIASDILDSFIDFHGQDVLFAYSTLILNSSNSLK